MKYQLYIFKLTVITN